MIIKNLSKDRNIEFKHFQLKMVKKERNRKTLKLESKNLRHLLRRKNVAEILIIESFQFNKKILLLIIENERAMSKNDHASGIYFESNLLYG